MVSAVVAGLEVLLEFERVKHRAALGALGPEAFRHVIALFAAAEAGFVENAHGGGNSVADEAVKRTLAAHDGHDNHLLNPAATEDPGTFVNR
jgi:hypothetical protein